MIQSYPSVYNLGHRNLEGLFEGRVTAQEKVDGSQFSFTLKDGVPYFRSKGTVIYADNVPTLFKEAVETVQDKARQGLLREGWVYRGEYLKEPKHNTLAYDRTPIGHIVLFDIEVEGSANFLSQEHLSEVAYELGLEVVPLLSPPGGEWNLSAIEDTLEQQSFLGGAPIEGIVFKNYHRFGFDKKPLFGKHVSEGFKEVHRGAWKAANPSRNDVIASLIHTYTTPARWEKAVQHLRDAGTLLDAPQDIGPLMREVNADILKECEDEIKEALWKHGWPQISRGTTKGLAEWYKNKLAGSQFESTEQTDESSDSATTE